MPKICKHLVMLVLILVAGCASEVAKLPPLDRNIQVANALGVLVVKLDNFDYLDITRIEDGADKDAIPLQYRILKPQRLLMSSYAKASYSIQPGSYYISYIAIDSDKGTYYSAAPGLDTQGTIAYGAFTVRPGDVLYLGDIACQWKSTNKVKNLALQDKITEVKKDLSAAGYPDLAAKIVNAKFYASGSNVSAIK